MYLRSLAFTSLLLAGPALWAVPAQAQDVPGVSFEFNGTLLDSDSNPINGFVDIQVRIPRRRLRDLL